MGQDRDLAVVESIYDALDGGRIEQALELARGALREQPEDDPVLRFLAGVALSELDRQEEAVVELERAVQLDPDDAEFRVELARALFRGCRFDEAREQVGRVRDSAEVAADAHHLQALLLERRGDVERADDHFRRATELDAERYPAPCRMDAGEFGACLERARARLPERFRKHLEQVGLIVEDLPPDSLLFEESPPLDPELLGLFTGLPVEERSYLSPGGELPSRIYLFKRNLERFAARPEELDEQIAVTLYHELGHYLGMDEDELWEHEFG